MQKFISTEKKADGEEESCADRKIIFFDTEAEESGGNSVYYPGIHYQKK
jgi:hypothetical protein